MPRRALPLLMPIALLAGAALNPANASPQGTVFAAAEDNAPTASEPLPLPPKSSGEDDRWQVGVGVRLSLLGAGAEVATSLSQHFNVRGGFNFFQYNRNFTHDGVAYKGQLNLRSGEAHLDWFPFHNGFHLSPGLLVYNGNGASANASVPANNTFTLGGVTYLSDPTNPVGGKGKMDFRKVSPSAMFGIGNLVPRHRHFSLGVEAGVIFQGAARTKLGLTGSACQPNGTNCVNAATDPTVLSNVLAEQTKLNNKLSSFKYYPVIGFGFGYRF